MFRAGLRDAKFPWVLLIFPVAVIGAEVVRLLNASANVLQVTFVTALICLGCLVLVVVWIGVGNRMRRRRVLRSGALAAYTCWRSAELARRLDAQSVGAVPQFLTLSVGNEGLGIVAGLDCRVVLEIPWNDVRKMQRSIVSASGALRPCLDLTLDGDLHSLSIVVANDAWAGLLPLTDDAVGKLILSLSENTTRELNGS